MAKSDNTVTAFLKSKPGQYIIAGGIVALVGYYLYKKSKENISTILHEDLNPASNKNLVNTALTDVGKSVTGNPQFEFDDWLSRQFGKSAAEKKVSQMLNEKVINP